ncbi:hypothetical protein PPYR_03983 [Photinus pyralis]|uniref:HMG box domain-containing protein n=1 Tax=Photinus pyralis TaxID=7054 RepID=A0A1Y1K1G0_PHOPY|nr:uncharacterized protein LOC116163434 isoform X1 [Photinus pyralis]XP_031334519.1 uncharacterized protein LOC116164474 isoform X1 [Photinus pyralis]KAB0801770.1 hypothetical protein PPYR_03956 [Photinus pyralis]KAB0801797.1 hypothetical protein PPYR_03983 [Photinus pyralis]
MEFQHVTEATGLLQNGILVATNKGLVCMSLTDAVSSDLNLSVEDLKTVAEQLILQDEFHKEGSENVAYSFAHPHCSSDTTLDSDDPASDWGRNKHMSQVHDNSPTVMQNYTDKLTHLKIDKKHLQAVVIDHCMSNVSDSDTNSVITNNLSDGTTESSAVDFAHSVGVDISIEASKISAKRRGGWPKGRKRKPQLLHLPPKAPATGYNLYLNDMRKQFKASSLAFHEITKIIGNKWSSLSLEEKKPYLERAEEDKKRYREELRTYRQSGSYQLYLAKKRKARVQNNVLSESDMDATDDIDDEDNEELYCRTCDQWFHNLHNKREHLQGRQHVQAVVGDMKLELGVEYYNKCMVGTTCPSVNEITLGATADQNQYATSQRSVSESMSNLMTVITSREKEIKTLHMRVSESKAENEALYNQLCSLREREATLVSELSSLKKLEDDMEMKMFELWKVPSLFVTTELTLNCSEN